VGAPGVLVTGSVVAVGEARTLLVAPEEPAVSAGSDDPDDDWEADYGDDGEPNRELWS
jgi:dihydrofolate synthase/folylpolyglutamate synthase